MAALQAFFLVCSAHTTTIQLSPGQYFVTIHAHDGPPDLECPMRIESRRAEHLHCAPHWRNRLAFAALLTISTAALGADLELVQAARRQVGITTAYDPSYRVLAFPNGDVPTATGVCTDVIARALRTRFGIDLQREIHEDIRQHRAAYPKNGMTLLTKPTPISTIAGLRIKSFFSSDAAIKFPIKIWPKIFWQGT